MYIAGRILDVAYAQNYPNVSTRALSHAKCAAMPTLKSPFFRIQLQYTGAKMRIITNAENSSSAQRHNLIKLCSISPHDVDGEEGVGSSKYIKATAHENINTFCSLLGTDSAIEEWKAVYHCATVSSKYLLRRR